MEEILSFCGTVTAKLYENEENGYTVIKLVNEEDDEEITATGIMPSISVGETIEAFGKWQAHKTYGYQFIVETYDVSLPSTERGIIDYLGSKVIKGIGKKLAERIVSVFGVNTFETIANHPEKLECIEGITLKKALDISQNFLKITHIRFIIDFLIEHNLPIEVAGKIYKRHPEDAVALMEENPYMLCDDYFGVDFTLADKVAEKMGIDPYCDLRSKAGILHVLRHNVLNGHSFIPLDKLVDTTAKFLTHKHEQVEYNIEELQEGDEVYIEEIGGETAVYLKNMQETESYVSNNLMQFNNDTPDFDVTMDELIEAIEDEFGKKYEEKQKQALKLVATKGVLILTGGPGTGKTTTVEGIIRVLEALGLNVLLCAPTGRAAKRMSEVCGREAKTIHRLLEPIYNSEQAKLVFQKNADNKIEADAIIIDEASMIDINLVEGLLKGLSFGTKIVFVGDPDQLPPVGAGNFLADVIKSEKFNVVALTEIFRQAKESLIVMNAHNVNQGKALLKSTPESDCFVKYISDEDDILTEVETLCKERLIKHYNVEQSQIQVISPSKKNKAGTVSINARLQEVLNPSDSKKLEKRFGNLIFRVGDKVMQVKNNYDIPWDKDNQSGVGIFNGEIGEIKDISNVTQTLTVDFDEKIAIYTFDMLNELDLAYALTVHKSQGSEFDVVVLAVSMGAKSLLTRNLLYTAITRAKKILVIVGDRDAISYMIDNDRRSKRYSGLKARIVNTNDD